MRLANDTINVMTNITRLHAFATRPSSPKLLPFLLVQPFHKLCASKQQRFLIFFHRLLVCRRDTRGGHERSAASRSFGTIRSLNAPVMEFGGGELVRAQLNELAHEVLLGLRRGFFKVPPFRPTDPIISPKYARKS